MNLQEKNNSFNTIFSIENLFQAVNLLKKKAPFLQDRSWLDSNLENKLHQLNQDLINGSYQLDTVQYFFSFLEKMAVKAHLSCRDWIMHYALVEGIVPKLKSNQEAWCFYEPENTSSLVKKGKKWKKKFSFVAKIDVQQFFASIQHDLLQKELKKLWPEENLQNILKLYLEAFDQASQSLANQGDGHSYFPNQGLPLGIELAHILSYAFLMDFDKSMVKLTKKEGAFGRYIDDVILFASNEEQLYDYINQAETALGDLGLFLNQGKTVIQSTELPFSYLHHFI